MTAVCSSAQALVYVYVCGETTKTLINLKTTQESDRCYMGRMDTNVHVCTRVYVGTGKNSLPYRYFLRQEKILYIQQEE